ncbi:N-acetylmuramoyl-L-alanine amidase [Mycobacterium kansasii]|uniref:N-acetylmuramoyl-L-alanine amidase n=1 Tax=Mycobacterium kansasii TaxID=1768 RepID=UPI001FAFDB01|nr:N-acetylmuramoyl-L-alanine amidase [Mycobacterium kansasii]
MAASEPGSEDQQLGAVNRRRLLSLAGGLGVSAMIDACSHAPAQDSASAHANDPSKPPAPNGGAPTPIGTTPSSEAPTFVPPAPRPAAAQLLCRDSWGARPALPGGRPNPITRATVHHSATVLGANSNAPSRFRQDQLYHQDQLGWIDIAYHVGIDHGGNIYELRKPEIAGDTATEYDPIGHFLVLCEGNFDQEPVSEPLFNSLALVCAWAAQRYNFPPDMVAAHRDFAQTACPGANLYARMTSGELRRQVKFLLENGGVDLLLLCGAEGLARVAAIEAGN